MIDMAAHSPIRHDEPPLATLLRTLKLVQDQVQTHLLAGLQRHVYQGMVIDLGDPGQVKGNPSLRGVRVHRGRDGGADLFRLQEPPTLEIDWETPMHSRWVACATPLDPLTQAPIKTKASCVLTAKLYWSNTSDPQVFADQFARHLGR